MALMQPIENPETGVTARYWKLTHMQADFVAGVLEAQLHGYRDEAARREGRQPLARLAFRFALDALPSPGFDRAAVYAAIRAAAPEGGRPLFARARDV
ncbi:MAG: hypothetical protein RMK64_04515 [Rhodovarius sp.]|nr:hypothetical protein [Rhodovarius sp.]MCX7933071.1 hypothetical protein [Rhodovarius sp.]MDW8314213.1 hypothetical protein [Rhodovarius sp.]